LEAIAAVARGVDGPRAQIEAMLPQLEENGWHLTDAVHRLWAGERDPTALTAGIDDQDAALVRHILQLLAKLVTGFGAGVRLTEFNFGRW